MGFPRRIAAALDGFVLGIFGVAAVATLLPATGRASDVLHAVTVAAIALLFFLYGTRLSPRDALDGLTHWRLHTVVLGCTYLLFPLLGLAMRVLTPTILTDELYTGMLYLCLVPSTIQSSIAFTSIARGNVAGAVVSASVSNLLGVVVTPVLVVLLVTTTGEASVDASAIGDILLQLLVPFLLGQLARRRIAGWVQRHASATKLVDRGSILLVVYAAFSVSRVQGVWSVLSPWRIAAVVAVCSVLLAVVLGLTELIGRLCRFDRGDRIVVLFCGSKKSLASGLPIASVLFAGQPIGIIVLPLLIFHQIQLVVCAVLAARYERQAIRDAASTS
ncbi:bile acid:sodium symporter family protein [Rhodococcoides corynebacterioides]|uniref:bile acid:sodium symporter family protein n=1 Tax=Rhodococcoides corynebacterioides TaxID=53972 RepID=UPI001C9B3F76|nr:bile acid:sodium symporter family protein [Rhodococcus corynebacterioides]MBY6351538.1 bile acid:sodium symporter [Rhodococcus corynebacterioides]MBY6363944.1 bile acid:sodium symporter [Rhodococcus corynebacterioides]